MALHFLLLYCFARCYHSEVLLFTDTLSSGTNFQYSGSVQFVSSAQCLSDGVCAEMPASDPQTYLETTAISTVGFVDIRIELQFTATNWASGSTLYIKWKPDASGSLTYSIDTISASELTQNSLSVLSFDLTGSASAENNENFGFYMTAYYNGNSFPVIYIDRISVYGTVDPLFSVTTADPTTNPSAAPTKDPSSAPTTYTPTTSTFEPYFCDLHMFLFNSDQ